MEFFKLTKTFNFMGKSKLAMIMSIVLVLSSFLILAIKGLNYGVDFAGGTIVQVKYGSAAPIDEMREKLKSNAIFDGASITEFGSEDEVVIRMRTTTGDVVDNHKYDYKHKTANKRNKACLDAVSSQTRTDRTLLHKVYRCQKRA